MNQEQENEKVDLKYIITKNVIQSGSWHNIPVRNVIESLAALVIVVFLINLIHFTSLVRVITSIIFGGAAFYLFLVGFKGRAVSEMLISEIRFRKNRRKLHLRGPEYKRKKRSFSSLDNMTDTTRAAAGFRKFKEILHETADATSES